jgi:gliding motility-associated lipoprotein GldH
MLCFLVVLVSCKNTTYDNYHSFTSKGWGSDSIVGFKYTITDTINKYNLRIKIRHTVDYEFQNLFLFVEQESKDTLEIMLANKNGKWLGSGISEVREFEYILEEEKLFSNKGDYELRLEQAMRYGFTDKIENLEHILDIGLIVSKCND